MMIGLSSKDLSLIDLSVLARWTIALRLMGVWRPTSPSGVNATANSRCSSIRTPAREGHHVAASPRDDRQRNVVSSLSFVEASTPGTGGFIETANQRLGIRHVFPIRRPGLAQVPAGVPRHCAGLWPMSSRITNP
jgi:hypothetical protein